MATNLTAEPPTPIQGLTVRQRETLLLVACGLSNAQIGARLDRSEEAIKSRVKDVCAALGGSPTRLDAVFDAIELGHVTFADVQAARAAQAMSR